MQTHIETEEFPRRAAPGYVTTVEELNTLDSDTMVRGYRAGFDNAPNYTEKDRAYWHGFLNGQVDGKHMQITHDQQQLARAYVIAQRTESLWASAPEATALARRTTASKG